MKQRTKTMLAQAMRLIACAIEQWDEDDDAPPEPTRLVDKDKIAEEKSRAELRRLGLL